MLAALSRKLWISKTTQCLKITQNVAFEFFTNFCPIIIDLSGNTVRLQASGYQKLDHF